MSLPSHRPRDRLDADFAALSQQVAGLETDYRDLKLSFINLDKKFDAGFAALAAKFDSRNVTPWATIIAGLGFVLAIMTTVGWMARQPLVDAQVMTRDELLRNADLRRTEDRRISDRQSELQSQIDRIRGAFDLMTRK